MPKTIRIKDHKKDAALVRSRAWAGALFVVLLVGVLVARLYYLQIIEYEYHTTLSENNRVHVQSVAPARGLIFDRKGVLLAENRPSFSLTLTRERAGDWKKTLRIIVDILNLDQSDLKLFEQRVSQGRRPFEAVPIFLQLTEKQIATISVNQYRLPGVAVATQLSRYYPLKEHFAHSVGYVGRINEKEQKSLDTVQYSGTHHIGKTGVERFYEKQLHGSVGYEEVETNARGKVLRVLKYTKPVPGKNITLTLDSKLQAVAEKALGKHRGAVVAIQPSTGDVLAMVSEPSFDPNPFVTGISFKAYAALRDSIDQPLFNRVLRGLYPPGSTVKPMVALSGLEAGVITPQTRIFDRGYFQLPGRKHKYRNWNRYGEGWVNLNTALMRSNDTYFYSVAHKLGIDRLHKYMSLFGFGQKVSLDMYGESAGLMPSKEWKRKRYNKVWYPGETLILGIGQGYMQTTPIQLAQAATLVATHGHWIRPHLAKRIGAKAPVDMHPFKNIILRDSRYWDDAQHGMEDVVNAARGTARRMGNSAVYRIAGKSGTAQVVAIKQGQRYNRNKIQARHRDHALFIAFAPAQKPQIVVAAMVENGESGSGVAAPIVKKVLDGWLLNDSGKLKKKYRPKETKAKL
ncbi:UNVERIFIED_CONTAM: hypothetical protein GTU68_034665 [Idotea baltica]|nr:hypothetical protein [Idotea baltica]